jgi:hypothetical protein
MNEEDIEPGRWYSAREAAPFLEIREDTLKNKLRSGEITGVQKGPKRMWYVKGTEIKRVRRAWNLDV